MKILLSEKPCKDEIIKVLSLYTDQLKKNPSYLDFQNISYLDECKNLAQKCSKYKHLVVLGIGGSALATASVIHALKKQNKITVLDHIDPEDFQESLSKISWNETCVNVVSKSGTTLEVLFQLSVIEKILQKKFPKTIHEKIICTTSKNSLLYNHALKQKYSILFHEKDVGGRFSVFTPVSLFPLMFAGVNIEKFLKSAERIKNKDVFDSIVLPLVSVQYNSYMKDSCPITVLMTYHKKLQKLWEWYRQLLAESLGKNKKVGITPMLAYGSTDQHSQIQLYTEGPKDKLIMFLSAPYEKDTHFYELIGMKKSVGINQMQEALFEGTKKGLDLHKRKFIELQFNQITESEIAIFFASHMMSINILADLLHVNALDQPGVEAGKLQAKKILG